MLRLTYESATTFFNTIGRFAPFLTVLQLSRQYQANFAAHLLRPNIYLPNIVDSSGRLPGGHIQSHSIASGSNGHRLGLWPITHDFPT